MKGKTSLTTKEIEKQVDDYIAQFEEGYFSPLALTARLAEEVGELAREVNHVYGEKPKKPTEETKSIEEEIGDILFVLACFTNSLNLEMGTAFQKTMDKFNIRDKNRWTKKSNMWRD